MNKKKILKQITLLLILLIISISVIGCMAEKVDKEQLAKEKAAKERVAKVHQEALEYLKDTYNEEFVIKDTRYIKKAKGWELTAAPIADQEFEFIVETGGMFGNEFVSNYARLKLTYQATKFYEPILKDIFEKNAFLY
ncbi:hypothetical protein [Orenia marismortui]|uniref:Lipoprotein n=1 Tax=Orenia marismortui TaxID=46469 RepID=A0A4R8HR50_9FIRM|nr:hypothetical protein [Orenia marismortui]TDX58967.1 hypothetical protein C7959_102105 [Orenia marismortui]